MGGICSTHRTDKKCVHNFRRKTCREIPLKGPRSTSRMENNIKIDHWEAVYEDVKWINLAQNRVQWWVSYFIISSKTLDFYIYYFTFKTNKFVSSVTVLLYAEPILLIFADKESTWYVVAVRFFAYTIGKWSLWTVASGPIPPPRVWTKLYYTA